MKKIRYLTGEEKNRTRAVWETVFPEDTKAFLDYYYSVKTIDNEILVGESDGRICSMLQLNPYHLNIGHSKADCAYVIAVATDEKHRHQGWMRELLTRAMKDRYLRKQPFLFLIPADEAIYRPFGFRYVMEQLHRDIEQGNSCGFCLQPVREEQEEEAAEFANVFLKAHADVYAQRNAEYYRVLRKESQSEDGGIAWIMKEGKDQALFGERLGLLAYTVSDRVEVREPLLCGIDGMELDKVLASCFPGQKIDAFGLLPDQAAVSRPTIMVRLLYLPVLFEGIRAMEDIEFVIRVHDDVLPENNGVFVLRVGPGEGSFGQEQIPSRQKPDLEVSVEALTLLLLGGYTPEDICISEYCIMTPEAKQKWKKILPIGRIWLNEVV